ncbi:MAG: FtsX-like permease family protein [Bryobacteraceae bacterium]
MINKLVFENLKHRPVRTLLSVCAVAIEVTMILTLVGVSRGVIEESQRRARGVGADIWVRPPGSSLMSFNSVSMPEKLLGFFETQPHVTLATGSANSGAGILESVAGVDFAKFEQLSGPLRFLKGGPITGPNEIIIDERYAQQKKLKPGGVINLWNRDWKVAGIYESGKLSRMMLPLETVQDLSGAAGKLSQIFLKVDDPANTASVVAALKANPQLAGYPIYSVEEWMSLFSVDGVPGLRPFIAVVIALGVIVGFLVVFLSMYTAVLERTREIGILKSLGASPGYILGILLRETAILALTGAVAGIAVTYGTRYIVNTYTGPAFTQIIVPDWWPTTTVIALVGALLGTLYPGLKAVRQDALEAISYE